MSESELLARTFEALGGGPTWRELQLVGDAVRESGDEEALKALESAADDRQAFTALTELAVASGASGFEALNLIVEVLNPSAHAALRRGRE